jgi:hypothetical protein
MPHIGGLWSAAKMTGGWRSQHANMTGTVGGTGGIRIAESRSMSLGALEDENHLRQARERAAQNIQASK